MAEEQLFDEFDDVDVDLSLEEEVIDTADIERKEPPVPETTSKKPAEPEKKGSEKKELEDTIDLIDLDELDHEDPEKEETEETEEIEDTEKSDDIEKESPDDNSSPSASSYLEYGKLLHDQGILPIFSEEEFKAELEKGEKTEDEIFLDFQRKQREQDIEDFKNSLSEEDRALYEAKELGVPLDKLGNLDKAINSYKNFTDDQLKENVDFQKNIITFDLKQRDFDEEDIKTQLEFLEENDKLFSQASRSKARILKSLEDERSGLIEEKRKEQDIKEKETQERIATMEAKINNTDEIIPGIKLTKKDKTQLYQDMFQPVGLDDNNKPIDVIKAARDKNPEAFDIALRYYYRKGLFNLDDNNQLKPDFSKIAQNLSTKEAATMKAVLSTAKVGKKGKGSSKSEPEISLFDDI